ncbi:MAG: DUF2284 domain-containing protein [Methanocella sp.]
MAVKVCCACTRSVADVCVEDRVRRCLSSSGCSPKPAKYFAFVNGLCKLYEKCNLENGICLHPNMARIPEHAVGINMKKTAAEAGMAITFPIGQTPEPMAILLID